MNLTTLARAKLYLQGVSGFTGADAMFNQLIAAASSAACQFCTRTFQRTVYAPARLNGNGADRQMLPNNPVIDVSGVSVNGVAYTEIPGDQAAFAGVAVGGGYQFDSKYIYLIGGNKFAVGKRNIAVSFVAGFSTEETDFIPASGPYTLTPVTGDNLDVAGNSSPTSGPAMVDEGVIKVATGLPMTAVGSSPVAGQYSFDGGVYTFAAADAGIQVTMSYDYVPGSVEQAVLDTVGTWVKRRDNLGIASKTIAQETVSYRDQGLSKLAMQMLQPYRWVFLPQ